MGAHLLKLKKAMLVFCFPISFSAAQQQPASIFPEKKGIAELKDSTLPAIVIKARRKNFIITGDTVSYSVSPYLKPGIKKVEDLLKLLEGFRVDDQGKVFYNGKEVDRILVDGEDLTGNEYGILSRNIQAGLIEQVKVYSRYNQNRLLKHVENSDKVALDLRFRDDKKNRVNGSIEAGYGSRSKYNAHIDAVGIFKQVKSVALFGKNNIGQISNQKNILGKRESGSTEIQAMNRLQFNPLKFADIPMPAIPSSYTLNNDDAELSYIGSFKVGSFQTIRFMSSIAELKQENGLLKKIQFSFPDNQSWQRNESSRFLKRNDIIDIKTSYKRDNDRNRISVYEISLKGIKNRSSYLNFRQGVIEDSINEQSRSSEKHMEFHGNETVKLGNEFVMYTEMGYLNASIGSGLIPLLLVPEVYQNYGFVDGEQTYHAVSSIGNISSAIYRNTKNLQTKFGFQAEHEDKKMGAGLIGKTPFASVIENNMLISSTRWNGSSTLGYNLSKKIFAQMNLKVGNGIRRINDSRPVSKSVYAVNYYLSHQKNPFNKWGVEVGIAREMPSNDHVFPSPILGHNSTILFGMGSPSFPATKNIEVNYQKSDFYRGLLFSISISGTLIKNDNSISFYNYTDHAVKSFFTAKKMSQLTNNIHFEKYFQVIKLKTIIESNGLYMKSPERINNTDTMQSLLSNEFKLTAISNFKGFFNAELTSSFVRSSVSGQQLKSKISNTIYQYRHSLKLNAALAKRVYVNLHFTATTNKGINTFFAGNGSIQWTIHKSLKSSILFHNIFNNSQFIEKQYDLYGSNTRIYFLEKRYILFSLALDL